MKNKWNVYKFECYFEGASEGKDKPTIIGFVKFLLTALTLRAAVLVCKHRGHKLIDSGSFANTETGQDHMTCTRCGFEFNHTYY